MWTFDSTGRIWALFSNGLNIGFSNENTSDGDIGVEATLPTPVGVGGWIHVQTPVAGTTATRVAVGQAGSNVVELLSVDPNDSNNPIIDSTLLQLGSPSTGRGVLLFVESDHSYLAVPMANNDISLIDMSSGALVPAVIHTNGPIVGLANAGQVGAGMLAAFGPRSGAQGVDLFNWTFDPSGAGFSATPRLPPVTFGTGAVTDAVFGAPDASGNPALFLTATSPGEVVRVSSTDGSVTTPFTDADSPGLGALDLDSIVYSMEKNKLIASDAAGHVFLLDGSTATELNNAFFSDGVNVSFTPMRMGPDGSLAACADNGSVLGNEQPSTRGILLARGF